MSETDQKPLKLTPEGDVGFSVTRREDGGMEIVFTRLSEKTLEHWREFALAHLIDSDRLTTNLYDLRQIKKLPEKAIQYAVEVNNDPSARNIRLAVVVSNDDVLHKVKEVQALTTPGGVEMEVFTDIADAEAWLQRPLTLVI
jgi:hypothetical protein